MPVTADSPFIHELALVDSSCAIGLRTKIWQFATVIRGTVLGEDCNVASCATLDGPKFGNRCTISQGVAMGPGFVFGDDCFVGPNVTVCNDRWPLASKENFDVEVFRDGFITVRIGDGVSIGANSVVLPGVEIGKGAMVAAGAVVNRSIPPGHLLKRDGRIEAIGSHRTFKRVWRAGEC